MTTKYPMPEPHPQAELIKAKADGAVIQERLRSGEWVLISNTEWDEALNYRIDPTCDYSIAKIAELGGDHMVDLYMYWLYGGELELEFCKKVTNALLAGEDPFEDFVSYIKNFNTIRKKKRMVTKTLWVCSKSYMNGENSYRPEVFTDKNHVSQDDIIEAGYADHRDMGRQKWYKVPDCTREVEVDENLQT